MTRLERWLLERSQGTPHYPDDVEILCRVVGDKTGRKPPSWMMQQFWEWHSDERCASWLFLGDSDDELWETLLDSGFPHDDYGSWYERDIGGRCDPFDDD
jgi:hypothetical protein